MRPRRTRMAPQLSPRSARGRRRRSLRFRPITSSMAANASLTSKATSPRRSTFTARAKCSPSAWCSRHFRRRWSFARATFSRRQTITISCATIFARSHAENACGSRTTSRMSGTYLPDLVHATLDLLIDGEAGVWHLANGGALTPEQLLIAAAEIIDLDGELIDGTPGWKLNRPALRPRNRVLQSERGQLLPPLEDALSRYCREVVIERARGRVARGVIAPQALTSAVTKRRVSSAECARGAHAENIARNRRRRGSSHHRPPAIARR